MAIHQLTNYLSGIGMKDMNSEFARMRADLRAFTKSGGRAQKNPRDVWAETLPMRLDEIAPQVNKGVFIVIGIALACIMSVLVVNLWLSVA